MFQLTTKNMNYPKIWDNDYNSIWNDMDKLFHTFTTPNSEMNVNLSVNLSEDDKNYYVETLLPHGIDKSDVNISFDEKHKYLSINVSKQTKKENPERKYHFQEISGDIKFYRNLFVPGAVIADKITAEQKENILEITLPKESKKEAKRQIEIN